MFAKITIKPVFPALAILLLNSHLINGQFAADGMAGGELTEKNLQLTGEIDNEVYTEFSEKLSKFSLNVFKNTVKSPLTTLDAASSAPAARTAANLFMAPLTAVSPLVMRSLAFESMFESVEEVLELMRLNRAFNHHFGGHGHGHGHVPRQQQQHPHQLANVFHQILGLFNPMQWDMAGGAYPQAYYPQQQPPLDLAPPAFMPIEPPPVRHHTFRGAGNTPSIARMSPLQQQPLTSAALTAAPSSLSLPAFKHNPNDGLQVAYFSKFLVPSQFHVNQTFAQHLHSSFGADVHQLDPHASASQVVGQLEQMLTYTKPFNQTPTTNTVLPANEAAAAALGASVPAFDNTTMSPAATLVDPNLIRNVGKTFERLVQPSWFEQQQQQQQAASSFQQQQAPAVAVQQQPQAAQQQPPGVAADPAANAIFVNGVDVNTQWEFVFDPRKTRREPFHASLLDIPEVEMMHQEGIFNVGNEDNIVALKLPLRGGQHSMLIMMPKKPKHTAQANIKQIVNELSWDLLRELKSEMKPRPVRLGLPKFRTTSALNMMQPLRMAGLRKQPTLGDYAGAFTEPLAAAGSTPSQILHFANIDINEAFDPTSPSTTSAAYTASYDAGQAARNAAFAMAAGHDRIQNFVADKPFVYIIQHEPTGTVLFAGKVENPALMQPSFSAPPQAAAASTTQQLVQLPPEPIISSTQPNAVLMPNVEPVAANGGTQTIAVAAEPEPSPQQPSVVVSGYSTSSVVDPQTRLPASSIFDTTISNPLLPPVAAVQITGVVVDPTASNHISGTQVVAPLATLK